MTPTTSAFASVPSSRKHLEIPLRRAVVSAPMRVSLAGGGSDLPPFVPGLGGRIVGTAIGLRTRAIVEPFDPGWVRLEVSATGLEITRREAEPRSTDVGARLLEEALALAGVCGAVRLRIETEVIPGAGLGGSAAAAVAALGALAAATGRSLEAPRLVDEAVRAERDGLSLACGSQDQTFAAHGGLLDLRFDDGGALIERAAPSAPPALLRALAAGMMLVDTGARRVSGEVIQRARYRVEETANLVAAAGDVARGMAAGDLESVITGMRRSAAAKVARDPEGSAAAREIEARIAPLGAEVVRICGAGGGGHVLVWARPDRHADIESALGGALVRRPGLAEEGVREEG